MMQITYAQVLSPFLSFSIYLYKLFQNLISLLEIFFTRFVTFFTFFARKITLKLLKKCIKIR